MIDKKLFTEEDQKKRLRGLEEPKRIVSNEEPKTVTNHYSNNNGPFFEA